MTIAQDFSSLITIGQPLRAHGLSVFPLFRMHDRGLPFTTLGPALQTGSVHVVEAKDPDGPWYRQLDVHNLGDLPVLVCDGDLLQGGQQDRVADRAVWVPGRSVRTVPVTCVEQNRSRITGRADFGAAHTLASPALRHHRRRHHRDQDKTWAFVAEARRQRGLADPSGSLVEAVHDTPDAQFPMPVDACGVVVARILNGRARVTLIDWYAKPDAFRGVWPRLRASILSGARDQPAPRVSRTEVDRVLKKVGRAHCRAQHVDDAVVQALEHKNLLGWATQVQGHLVHLTATLA